MSSIRVPVRLVTVLAALAVASAHPHGARSAPPEGADPQPAADPQSGGEGGGGAFLAHYLAMESSAAAAARIAADVCPAAGSREILVTNETSLGDAIAALDATRKALDALADGYDTFAQTGSCAPGALGPAGGSIASLTGKIDGINGLLGSLADTFAFFRVTATVTETNVELDDFAVTAQVLAALRKDRTPCRSIYHPSVHPAGRGSSTMDALVRAVDAARARARTVAQARQQELARAQAANAASPTAATGAWVQCVEAQLASFKELEDARKILTDPKLLARLSKAEMATAVHGSQVSTAILILDPLAAGGIDRTTTNKFIGERSRSGGGVMLAYVLVDARTGEVLTAGVAGQVEPFKKSKTVQGGVRFGR